MPKRKTSHHFTSTEAQGEDSWIEVRGMTGEEGERLATEARRLETELQAMRADEGVSDAEYNEAQKEASRKISELLAAYVLDWNWVDDEGEPLPKPLNNPDALQKLTNFELAYVRGLFSGASSPKKKR